MRTIFRFLGMLLALAQGLLWVRFVFRLLAIGSSNKLVAWLYNITDILISPFAGTFPNIVQWKITIELTTLFAIVIYAFLHFIVGRMTRGREI
jgi:hypothetical protein